MPKLATLLLGLPLLMTACAAPGGAGDAGAASPSAIPHGYIAGAQEQPEPQIGLLTVDQKSGTSHLLSLLTEATVDTGAFGRVDAVEQEGRYAFVTAEGLVHVLDTGAWTVDHGDHKHYYSAEPGSVGTISVPGAGAVAGDGMSVAVFSTSEGYASVYRHEDLDAGIVAEKARTTSTPHQGRVIPYGDHFIVSIAGQDGTAPMGIEVRDADNQVVLPQQSCPGLSAHTWTRVGVVLSCADGALLVRENDGAFAAEKIPYPAEAAGLPPVTKLEHRPGSNELAAPAGEKGIWHLNVSKKTWTLLATPVPVVAASAVGDGKRVLALGVDGSLMSVDPAKGTLSARAQLLEPLPPTRDTMPQIRIDSSRAYLSDPGRSRALEIDYKADLRVARTFDLPASDIMLEVGL
ncbi:hypothetical protein [Sinomonas mesophila]|uniref:hypothetical protein n=1 Tax=Sinomonas mesophila TaxID=1531955 RepID=UPI001FEAD045|nr:hypothetical protein [Sinomonas mesophila]